MQYLKTFKIKSCYKITVNQYKKASDSRDGKKHKSAEISNKHTIDKIIKLLNALPDKGEIMISWGPVPLTEVIMHNEDGSEFFSFYNSRIKTPDTSFYSEKYSEEEKLYNLFISHIKKQEQDFL